MDDQNQKLIRRIASLIKENQELLLQKETYSKLNADLLDENQRLRQLLETTTQKGQLEIIDKEREDDLRFKMATVLFANIHGFTKIATSSNSEALMDELDTIFLKFDNIVKKYNIQKIKTIGDTYMCAGGIPVKNQTNPIEVVLAALEMKDFLTSLQGSHDVRQKIWDIRLGIHTGPVSANITGKRKVAYDIKGETVNIASRIESSADMDKLFISVMTYELVKEFFDCEYFGRVPVKYTGDLELFVVKSIKPEYTIDGKGILPNDKFNTKFALIKFYDLQEIILDRLERELPNNLYYHNVKHTVDVVTEVELIGWAEGISEEDILLLKTAALFHDAGHVISYDNHENYGTDLVREYLPNFNYTTQQINKICDLIMATKLPPNPKNKLEEIICDSDLDYLGRSDFIPVSNTLYKELKERSKIGTLNEWNKLQIDFISNHQYFTKTARNLREVNKQKQIDRIKKLIV
ncbi:MAG: HD domain-containing protein [Bacteroidales bacterium]|nr:HD domain-containing protein [Bacteroidales bacterium]